MPGTDINDEVKQDIEELYRNYKNYAFAIAYRMLGTAADAEDVVQDCFTELARRDRSGISNMKAYLAKGITNRCLNLLQSARSRRETYTGEWLPEPITASYDGPEATAERQDTLSYAFLVLLEKLAPAERAIFLLREVFEYEYEAIAEIMNKSEANCRKIFSRAKRSLQPETAIERRRLTAEPGRAALLKRFSAAFAAYDVSRMLELLAENPVFISDGGEHVHTVLRPMKGQKGVLALLTSRRVLYTLRDWETTTALINGELNIVYRKEGQIMAVLCMSLNRSADRIEGLYLMLDPEKLQHIIV
ncbi:sigma-70 family RNA polymerase sigma factor [Paenibacillus sp. sgz500958]|uniref:sigma-70 family RNA polymerase sigma factor n=1 Tax=Paenibacillus sp. sgz500958 TaxID=3242475 RepID=UPI0036D43867